MPSQKLFALSLGAVIAAMIAPEVASANDDPKTCSDLVQRPVSRVADEPPAVRKALGSMSDIGGPFHQWQPLEPPPSHADKRLVFSGRWKLGGSGAWLVVYEEAGLLPLTHLVIFIAPWPTAPGDMEPVVALRTETSAGAADKLCKSASALFYAQVTTERASPDR
jgi:hypothetical protein